MSRFCNDPESQPNPEETPLAFQTQEQPGEVGVSASEKHEPCAVTRSKSYSTPSAAFPSETTRIRHKAVVLLSRSLISSRKLGGIIFQSL